MSLRSPGTLIGRRLLVMWRNPYAQHPYTPRGQWIEQRLLYLLVLRHLLHVGTIDDQVRHFKHAITLVDRAHDRRRRHHLGRCDPDAFDHLLVGTELARVKNLDFHLAFQGFVHVLRELVADDVENRAGETHVSQPDGYGLLCRGGCGPEHDGQDDDAENRRRFCGFHGSPPWWFFVWHGPSRAGYASNALLLRDLRRP